VWLIGAVVCPLAANRGSNRSLTRAMDGRIVRCSIISSCQSAPTSKTVKALLVLSPFHVRSAIASTGLYPFLPRPPATAHNVDGGVARYTGVCLEAVVRRTRK